MKISQYEKDVVIPAIRKAEIKKGNMVTHADALNIFLAKQKELGENNWLFVLWKRQQVKDSEVICYRVR